MSQDLIPEGYYSAVVVPVATDEGPQKVQFGFTKENKRQIAVCFEVIDGDYIGHKLTWFGYFTEKTTERTIQALRYCGFRGDDLMTVNEQALDQAVSITVEHAEYNGKISAKIAWVNAPGGGGFKLSAPMKKNDMRRFAAEMRMAVRGIPDAPGEKAVRGGRSSSSGEDLGDEPGVGDRHIGKGRAAEDDIPF
jgi:hypothetical protein